MAPLQEDWKWLRRKPAQLFKPKETDHELSTATRTNESLDLNHSASPPQSTSIKNKVAEPGIPSSHDISKDIGPLNNMSSKTLQRPGLEEPPSSQEKSPSAGLYDENVKGNFTYFPQLPMELQLKIWGFVIR